MVLREIIEIEFQLRILGLKYFQFFFLTGQPIASDMSPTPTPQDISDTVVKIEDAYK